EMARVRINERQHLVEQLGIGKDRTTAKVDKTLVYTVTLRSPAVLVDQHTRIDAPALVFTLEPPKHAQQATEQRSDRQRVVECRAAVGDAHFKRWKACARPQIPPQLGRVLDQPGATRMSTCRRYSPQLPKRSGDPV